MGPLIGDKVEANELGSNESPPLSQHSFSKILDPFSRCGKVLIAFFKVSGSKNLELLRGPKPKFLAHLSLRMDLFAHYDSNAEIKRYCIQKNGNFPSSIDHHDSLKSITFSKPNEVVRRLLFAPLSDASILHEGALWGWTPDGVYIRILIGDVSMLLTFKEVASLRGILFPQNRVGAENSKG